jgi:hypothetical protein
MSTFNNLIPYFTGHAQTVVTPIHTSGVRIHYEEPILICTHFPFRIILAAACAVVSLAAVAAESHVVRTKLTGYQETPSTINSAGSGEFKAVINDEGSSIDYVLNYQNLSSPALQSHIHFGRPALTGSIVLFLCTNLAAPANVPAPQSCPAAPATIRGTLTAANVIAVTAQGIDAGAQGFAEIVKAIQADSAYVNVHTTLHPSGEIRGRLAQRSDD